MSQGVDRTVKDEALGWVLRRESRGLSPAETRALEAWLARSPEHRSIFTEADIFWSAVSQLEHHPRLEAKLRWADVSVDRGRWTRRSIAASVAAAVLGLGSATALYLNQPPRSLVTQTFSTAVGQQATVTLPDGSSVTLNTDTLVRTKADEGRRLVYLDKGQAYFRVAKNPRHPFVVTAAGRTVTALGTAFEVRVDKGALKVVLVEGKVRVESARPAVAPSVTGSAAAPATSPGAPMATDMSAGSQLVAPDDADWRLTRTNVARETSWLRGQIIFDDEPLGDVVTELNRYSARKIVLADGSLVHRRISGIYTPGDVQGFTAMLKEAGLAEVVPEPDGAIKIVALK